MVVSRSPDPIPTVTPIPHASPSSHPPLCHRNYPALSADRAAVRASSSSASPLLLLASSGPRVHLRHCSPTPAPSPSDGAPPAMESDGKPADALGDIFGPTLSLEESHKEEGYREGFADGMAAGREEARLVGLKHGFAVGEELGFYRGCADVWVAVIRVDSTAFSARVQRGIGQIVELLDRYPLLDAADESTQEALEAIRLRFRAVTASLGVRLEYKGQPKSSDAAKGTDF